ncbi:MAG: hypothetical protein JW829_09630 [Pirellulales bacterium]|nr:hypothetical protein [Pirellulales bacterium]
MNRMLNLEARLSHLEARLFQKAGLLRYHRGFFDAIVPSETALCPRSKIYRFEKIGRSKITAVST